MAKKRTEPKAEVKEQVVEAPQVMPDLLMEEENEAGTIRISENVIAAIVRKYALEVQGVVRFASGSPLGSLVEMFGRKTADSNLVVDLEDELVTISVTLVMEFGVRIPDVAAMVQDVVRTKVGELTGKQATKVNVMILDLEEIVQEEEAAVEEAAE
ncbi:MAG: Asp23/Gls24 family envelope stress response protein [Lentisphaeria bacterium]|nr:Asp23/Gls24 family envelope stress response protein [Lentisphaeria bacterium]